MSEFGDFGHLNFDCPIFGDESTGWIEKLIRNLKIDFPKSLMFHHRHIRKRLLTLRNRADNQIGELHFVHNLAVDSFGFWAVFYLKNNNVK